MLKFVTLSAVALGLFGVLSAPVRADETAPAAAKTLLAAGQKKAAKQKKRVLVMFHATW